MVRSKDFPTGLDGGGPGRTRPVVLPGMRRPDAPGRFTAGGFGASLVGAADPTADRCRFRGKAWTAANRCELRDAALRTAPPPGLYAWARPSVPPDARLPGTAQPSARGMDGEVRNPSGCVGVRRGGPSRSPVCPRCRRRSGLDVPRWRGVRAPGPLPHNRPAHREPDGDEFGPIHRGVPPAIAGFRDGSLFRVGRLPLQRGCRTDGVVVPVDGPAVRRAVPPRLCRLCATLAALATGPLRGREPDRLRPTGGR